MYSFDLFTWRWCWCFTASTNRAWLWLSTVSWMVSTIVVRPYSHAWLDFYSTSLKALHFYISKHSPVGTGRYIQMLKISKFQTYAFIQTTPKNTRGWILVINMQHISLYSRLHRVQYLAYTVVIKIKTYCSQHPENCLEPIVLVVIKQS